MPPSERASRDALIGMAVAETPAFRDADVVLCYLSMGTEVETRGIISHALGRGTCVGLPVSDVVTHGLRWYEAGDPRDLVRSAFGVLEPDPDASRHLDLGIFARPLAVVPGLCFDAQGFRLGYGAGFYDRFLAGFGGVSLGLCRQADLVDDLAAMGALEDHDWPVGLLVTEEGVRDCSARRMQVQARSAEAGM